YIILLDAGGYFNMESLDEENRSIKRRLRKFSSEPAQKGNHGRERQVQIRKMKDKLAFLKNDRAAVKNALGQLKADQKALNRAINNRSVEFAHAFVAAAERDLPHEVFSQLEQRAALMLEANK
ncbi:hypothetical protein, partial [Thiolapillus sp.]|uniref:hypothetical protein n=1 Tax=Thiolapillus sp. TaxID=2017437 RepID=UPI003AF9309D